MLSKRIVIDYYENLVNIIDIIAEKRLAKRPKDSKRDKINSTRSLFLDKIKEIQDLNLEYCKIDGQSENAFRPKVCFPINQSDNALGKLVIAKHFINDSVLDLLDNRSTKPVKSNKTYLTSQIYRKVFDKYKDDLIIDISNDEKFKIEELDIKFGVHLEHDDFNVIENMIDPNNLTTLHTTFLDEFIFKNDIFSNFVNLKLLNLCLNSGCTFEPDCFKSLINLEELIISGFIEPVYLSLSSTMFSLLKKLKKLQLSSIKCTKPFEAIHLLNIQNIEIQFFKIDFETSPIEGMNSIKTISCQDSSINLITPDYFKSFKCLLYLNLNGTSITNFNAKSLDYLENLEYLNLLFDENGVNSDFVFSDLNLPKLKYLAIECEQVPEFKHLQLEYLKLRGLKRFDSLNLMNQLGLIGLCLMIDKNVYYNLSVELGNLVHLEI